MPAFENSPGGYKVSSTAGTRQGLFAPSVVVQNAGLDGITLQMERELAKAMLGVAIKARDMARRLAPEATGALRAGIYVTGLVTKEELAMVRDGDEPFAHKMMGHTQGYWKALNAAARRSENDVPGVNPSAGDTRGSMLFTRTQRLRGKTRGQKLQENFGRLDYDNRQGVDYKSINDALPFNEFAPVKRENLFVGLGSLMYYSAWVEYGTSRMAARPFFTPAANWMQTHALAEMVTRLRAMNGDVRAITGGTGKYLRPPHQAR